jgi:hypothetical protein
VRRNVRSRFASMTIDQTAQSLSVSRLTLPLLQLQLFANGFRTDIEVRFFEILNAAHTIRQIDHPTSSSHAPATHPPASIKLCVLMHRQPDTNVCL